MRRNMKVDLPYAVLVSFRLMFAERFLKVFCYTFAFAFSRVQVFCLASLAHPTLFRALARCVPQLWELLAPTTCNWCSPVTLLPVGFPLLPGPCSRLASRVRTLSFGSSWLLLIGVCQAPCSRWGLPGSRILALGRLPWCVPAPGFGSWLLLIGFCAGFLLPIARLLLRWCVLPKLWLLAPTR